MPRFLLLEFFPKLFHVSPVGLGRVPNFLVPIKIPPEIEQLLVGTPTGKVSLEAANLDVGLVLEKPESTRSREREARDLLE